MSTNSSGTKLGQQSTESNNSTTNRTTSSRRYYEAYRLRWFGHVNRMENNQGEASLSKKVMFSYFPNEKRPGSVRIRKRWEVKITNGLEKCSMKNWRRETKDRDLWEKPLMPK